MKTPDGLPARTAGRGAADVPSVRAKEAGAPLAGGRPLELAQHLVAARHGRVERRLRGLLARQRPLDLLGPDVAQLDHVAEAKPARVLGGWFVGQLKQRDLEGGRGRVEARSL